MPPKTDVRRLLKKQQAERTKTAKVDHPFAKYDDAGRLFCIVCNSLVKSDSVWQAHLGSLAHRENIQKLKAVKQQQQQQLKRPAPINAEEQNKRIRIEQSKQDIELSEEDVSSEEEQDEDMGLPADFFDEAPTQTDQAEEVIEESTVDSGLPSGFFDDPDEEAKVQGSLDSAAQAKLNLEKDLEEFNEAMVDVTKETREAQEEDDELFWQERHLEISMEQAEFDSRVEKLKQLRQSSGAQMAIDTHKETGENDDLNIELKTSVRQLLKNRSTKQQESMFDDDDLDDSDEEDWRALQL